MLNSDARSQNLVPPTHVAEVIGAAMGGQVAVVGHHDQAAKAVRVNGTQAHQLSVDGLQVQAGKLGFKLSESTRGLLVLLGLSRRANDTLDHSKSSQHQAPKAQQRFGAARNTSEGGTAKDEAHGTHERVHAVVKPFIHPVKDDGVSNVHRGFVSGARVLARRDADAAVAHSVGGGGGGGGLRNGGACVLPSRLVSMGGPFGVVDGVGALTVPKCDRPPYTWPTQAANDESYVLEPARLYDVRYTLRDGSTGQLSVISRSRAGAIGRVQRDHGPNLRLVSARALP